MILLNSNSTIDTTEDNSFNQQDLDTMDSEEVFTFNVFAQQLDDIEEALENFRGIGVDFDVDKALIHVLMIKRRLHLSVLTF